MGILQLLNYLLTQQTELVIIAFLLAQNVEHMVQLGEEDDLLVCVECVLGFVVGEGAEEFYVGEFVDGEAVLEVLAL